MEPLPYLIINKCFDRKWQVCVVGSLVIQLCVCAWRPKFWGCLGWIQPASECLCTNSLHSLVIWFCMLWFLLRFTACFVYIWFFHLTLGLWRKRNYICYLIYAFPWCLVISSAHHKPLVNTIESFSMLFSTITWGVLFVSSPL